MIGIGLTIFLLVFNKFTKYLKRFFKRKRVSFYLS